MAARNRMPPWHEHVRLPNGREVLIRPIRPEDAEPMRAAFTLLKPDEVRQRFLHPMKELGAAQIEQLVRPDPRRDFALVAAEPLPPGEALVGAVARVSVEPNGKDAEFAILVSHYVNGMGLGRRMMRKLVRWARGRKVQRIYGDVLESNQPMQSLAGSLGFHREASSEAGLVRMVLDLPPPKPKIPRSPLAPTA
ncbi:GNAT family N-acetyltransferase [Thermomonas sp.]|uniref:GNAT family N-acetyltransferase n=1 Tax=Thermomonas sp. TaxID=1971895 RepID=UPI001D7E6029|nr:GNAT family N-acetyltransferase [Thermomonas sp.]MBZ0088685.1 GNAT family N-acetyltransferase [Thermomonas sp.]MCO5056202.1 GNAT family N-acetyltransferase [Thermomonas sp.]HRO64146.1 GNAT family N-acetyltransferase [Thermomonas sp.]